jgi:thiol:disulfide interchange protein
MFIGILCAVLLSCGGKKDEPIFKPETAEDRYSKDTGELYNVGGNAPVQDTSKDQPYQSPFGPKPPKEIQWAASLKDATTRAKAGSGLKILLWFTNRACDECGKIEKEVFTADVVLKQAGKYIWVKFDTDTDPQMKKYYIQDNEPPALVWLDKEGNSYHKLFGGFDNPELLARYLMDYH